MDSARASDPPYKDINILSIKYFLVLERRIKKVNLNIQRIIKLEIY
jgi:hypothetical protein